MVMVVVRQLQAFVKTQKTVHCIKNTEFYYICHFNVKKTNLKIQWGENKCKNDLVKKGNQ